MTLTEFKNKYLGKQVEYHSYGTGALNQCVDLVNAYINEVLDTHTKDYTEIIGANAKDFNTKYDPEDFEWIANTPTGVPVAGDIVVWNGKVGGGAGHVAIFLEGNVNSFKSLDQNWSQVEWVTLETHNYTNVSGWLRPKKASTDEPLTVCLRERKRFWEERDLALAEVDKQKNLVTNLNQQINDRKNDITKLNGEVSTLKDMVLSLEQSKDSLTEQAKLVAPLQKENAELKKSREEYINERMTYIRQIGQLKANDYTLMPTTTLVQEVISRILKLK